MKIDIYSNDTKSMLLLEQSYPTQHEAILKASIKAVEDCGITVNETYTTKIHFATPKKIGWKVEIKAALKLFIYRSTEVNQDIFIMDETDRENEKNLRKAF